MSLNNFVPKYGLKNKAISNVKIHQNLSTLSLNDVKLFLRDGLFSREVGCVNLQP